jgi:hypothetical protein
MKQKADIPAVPAADSRSAAVNGVITDPREYVG